MGSKFSKAVRRRAGEKAAVTQVSITQTTTASGNDARDTAPACHQVNTQVAGNADRQETSIINATELKLGDVVLETAKDVEDVNRATQEEGDIDPLGEVQASIEQPVPTTAEQSTERTKNMALVTVSAPVKKTIMCVACREDYPKEDEYKDIVYPCRPCGSSYCGTCLKRLFTRATESMSNMPPRCCGQLQLHVAKPFLSEDEAAAFRAKYDEWSTKNPMYCPVPTCSVFISNRLLKGSTKTGITKVSEGDEVVEDKGKQRVDSVIGTPTSNLLDCPSCKTSICVQCRQLAHPGLPCSNLEFGQIDEATAKLLKEWGYKRCPKCGTGVRRMFGCNHMQCLCGAHWCWECQLPKDDCDGGCYEAEDDCDPDYEDEIEVPIQERDIGVAVDTQEGAAGESVAGTATPAQPTPAPRERNLDAGSRNHWEDSGFNFGDEPSDDIADRAWECYHSFKAVKAPAYVSLAQVEAAATMECSRCWTAIYPEVESTPNIDDKDMVGVASECRYCGIVVCEQCKGDC